MDLQRNSLEYCHLVFSIGLPVGAITEASFDLKNWVPVLFDPDGTGKVLLRGPDYSGSTGLLVAKSNKLWIRVTAAPEVIVRSAGLVTLY